MRFSPHWTFGIMLMALTAQADSPTKGPACNGPQLKLDPYLKARKPWVSAVHTASKRLTEYGEVDRCAILDIQWMGAEAVVRASVPDGRSAIRHVGTPGTLTDTVVALLALPNAPLALADAHTTQDSSTSHSSSPTPASSRTGSPSAQRNASARGAGEHEEVATADIPIPQMDLHEVTSDTGTDDTGSTGAGSSRAGKGHTEVGAFTSAARLSGSDVFLAGIGAGALVEYETNGWLLGALGRAEKLYNLNDARSGRLQSEIIGTVGPTIGRRLTHGKVWVDAVIPVEVTFESSKVQPVEGQPQTVSGVSRSDLRIGAMVRGSWSVRGPFRVFGSFDADISPARLFSPPDEVMDASGNVVERRPPRFSLGLSVGVLWGAL
jgi:hypothetical protein